jgi:UDP-glucose 4-epimerase
MKVTTIAEMVAKEMGLSPSVVFEGGTDDGRGWAGDVKEMLLDVRKLVSTGWAPKYNSKQAVLRTVRQALAPKKKEVENRR